MQRVAVARALITEPEAILCDEPTGNLDSANSKAILSLLRTLPEAGRRAVVMVTHDPVAAAYGDRIIHIRDGLLDREELVTDEYRSGEVSHAGIVSHVKPALPVAALALNSLVVLIIAAGVSIWVATSALYQSLEQSILVSVNPMPGLADLQISNGDAGVPGDLLSSLSRIDGVKSVRPIVVESVRVVLDDKSRHPVMLLGMERPKSGDGAFDFPGVQLSDFDLLAYLRTSAGGPPPAVVGGGLQSLLPPGTKQIKLAAGGKTQTVTRVGTVEASGPLAGIGGSVLLMDWEVAAQLVGRPNRVSRLDILLKPEADREAVAAQIRSTLGGIGEGQVRTPEANDNRLRELLAPLKVGSLVVSAGALVVGMFLVFMALSVNVAERRHDIGVLRSLGATRDQVRRLFQGEALLLGLFGSLLGLPLGLLGSPTCF